MPSHDNLNDSPFTFGTGIGGIGLGEGGRARANSVLANWGLKQFAPGQTMAEAIDDAVRSRAAKAVSDAQAENAANKARFQSQLGQFDSLAAEQAAQQAQSRGAQWALINQLQNQASGLGPSLAQAQLQQATDRNMQQAMALGVSQRGAGQGAALHNIANQRAGIGQQMAGDSAMLRMQEQLQARQMLGGLLGGMNQSDLQGRLGAMGGGSQLGLGLGHLNLADRAEYHNDLQNWEQARQGQTGIDYRNTWGPVNTILGAVGLGGQMLGGGLEAYGQIKKGGG